MAVQLNAILSTKKLRLIRAGEPEAASRLGLIFNMGRRFCVIFSWTTVDAEGLMQHHLATSQPYYLRSVPQPGEPLFGAVVTALALDIRLESRLPVSFKVEDSYVIPEAIAPPPPESGEHAPPAKGSRAWETKNRNTLSSGKAAGGARERDNGAGTEAMLDEAELVAAEDEAPPFLAIRTHTPPPPLPSAATFSPSDYPSPPPTHGLPAPAGLILLTNHVWSGESIIVYSDPDKRYAFKLGLRNGNEPQDLELVNEVEMFRKVYRAGDADKCVVQWHGTYTGDQYLVLVTELGEPCYDPADASDYGCGNGLGLGMEGLGFAASDFDGDFGADSFKDKKDHGDHRYKHKETTKEYGYDSRKGEDGKKDSKRDC
ncbi:hypothetical protein JCM10213_003017 [Rhodosporidiobolus nylandii]